MKASNKDFRADLHVIIISVILYRRLQSILSHLMLHRVD
jgi:hypothetical protein